VPVSHGYVRERRLWKAQKTAISETALNREDQEVAEREGFEPSMGF
jgi:hypothetical protein